jgi:hypothetical protein
MMKKRTSLLGLILALTFLFPSFVYSSDLRSHYSFLPSLGGTANQILGMNAGATGGEWKTVNGVANETDVTHAANSITIGIIDPLALSKGGTAKSLTASLGALPYSDADSLELLAGNITATRKFLMSLGTGAAAQAPSYDTLTKTDVGLANGDNLQQVPIAQAITTLTANSATPALTAGKTRYKTANANPTTYTNFTGGSEGLQFSLLVNDAVSTFDFTGSSLNRPEGTDYVASSGDVLVFIHDGTNWTLESINNVTGAIKPASTTVAGVTEYATDAETITGTKTDAATTPANIRALLDSGTSIVNKIVDGHAALSLSAAQVSGTMIYNTGQGPNDISHTLPATAAGYSFIADVGESQAAKYWRFTAATAGTMCLDGVCEKNYVQFATPMRGNSFVCYTQVASATGLNASAALAIGSTNTAVATGAFTFDISGTGYSKTAVAAGTAPGNDVIPQSKYGAVALDIGADGTIDAIEATDNATGYNSAALAIAGLPAVAASHTRLGTVTAMKSDGNFTFGTTALNAASTTVAYTSTATYTKPYWWYCRTLGGTATTN